MAIDQEVLDKLDELAPEELKEVVVELVQENKLAQTNAKNGVEIMNQAITFYKES